jgi:hypothetical protein
MQTQKRHSPADDNYRDVVAHPKPFDEYSWAIETGPSGKTR